MDRASFFRAKERGATSSLQQFDAKLSDLQRLTIPDREDVGRTRSSSFGTTAPRPIPKGRGRPTLAWTSSVESVTDSHTTSRLGYPRSPSDLSYSPVYQRTRKTSVPTLPKEVIKTILQGAKFNADTSKYPAVTAGPAPLPQATTGIHAHEYKMDHKSRGKAIILNHINFKEELETREGTNVDVKRLVNSLQKLNFKEKDILVYNDLTWSDIDMNLEKLKMEDHSNSDCFMLFVLTHGDKDDRIHAHDIDYSVQKLWKHFTAEKCGTLAGKPKMFFIIACRGSGQDSGAKVQMSAAPRVMKSTVTDAAPIGGQANYTIPVWADFLTIYSTVQGYFSYREKENGTWYIQALCDEIDNAEPNTRIHFMDLLTRVNRRVAISKEIVGKKQCPFITTTLTRSIYMQKPTLEYISWTY